MAKIVLPTIASTTDVSLINENFRKIAEDLNTKVMYRKNPVGESNTLDTNMDANGKQIYNLPAPTLEHQAARFGDIKGAIDAAGDAAEAALTALAASDLSTVASGVAVDAAADALVAKTSAELAASNAAGVLINTVQKTELALTTGASLVGFQRATAGTYPLTLEEIALEKVLLIEFIPKAQRAAIFNRTTTYDSSDDIMRAISYCNSLPSGAELIAPAGKFICTKPVILKNNVCISGKGKLSTLFEFTNSGDGFVSNNPINSSTSANICLRWLSVNNTNASNTGGGFVDVAGSYVYLDTVRISNFKYGTIFDQTEHAAIDKGEYVANTTGGVWIVNGPTHTPGASNAFTNQIVITRTQFNVNGTHIIDDGGVSHSFDGNNFNGGGVAMRIAGARVVTISNNEIEYFTTEGIRLIGTRQSDGTGVGQCFEVSIEHNFFIAPLNIPCIAITNGTALNFELNDYQTTGTSSVYAVTGCSNVIGLISKTNTQTGFIDILDAIPTKLFQTDFSTFGNRQTKTQFFSPANTLSAIETYSPSSAGGGTSIGGIDLSADNSSASKTVYAKIRPAIYGNGVGAEAGGLHIDLSVAGVPTFSYSFIASSFRPAVDNTKTLGQANLRWSGLFTTALTLTPGTAPASATAAGIAGEIRVVSGFIYVCVATNTWQRSPLATW